MSARHSVAVCKSCAATIIWAQTASGKRMPVDAAPSDDGTVELVSGRPPTAVVHSRDDAAEVTASKGIALRTSHFATCPKADKHRRRVEAQRTPPPHATPELFGGDS